MRSKIMVIPDGGDSVETEQWYLEKLKEHYGREVEVIVFDYGQDLNVRESIRRRIFEYAKRPDLRNLEIHAQGGLGAYTACQMLFHWDFGSLEHRIKRIFFIGGAPSSAMTWIAKLFHRYFAYIWYLLPIPFFADDPNPHHDPIIDQIRASSTRTMRTNPKLYRNQLAIIGNWGKDSDLIDSDSRDLERWLHVLDPKRVSKFTLPDPGEYYFIPNGETVRPKWWDNTYNLEKATKVWIANGAKVLPQPGDNFSFYSLMPAKALFRVMDDARQL